MRRVKIRDFRAVEWAPVRAQEDAAAAVPGDDRLELCEIRDCANALDPFIWCPRRCGHPPEEFSGRQPAELGHVLPQRTDESTGPSVSPFAGSIRRAREQH